MLNADVLNHISFTELMACASVTDRQQSINQDEISIRNPGVDTGPS
jgi:hypothetical protein